MRNVGSLKASAAALAILGLSLLGLIWNGKAAEFVDPILIILLFPVGLGSVALAQVVLAAEKDRRNQQQPSENIMEQKSTEESSENGWGLLWLAIPLIIGFLFPG